jgi:6-phosphogluconolactonase
MTDLKVLIFDSISQLVENFSLFFIDLIKQKEGDFCVALSGGSTPKVWFEELAKNHKKDIPWEKVHFYWGDERCVPPLDEESNFGMTKKYLLDHVHIPPQNIHRIHGELAPELAAKNYENDLVQNLTMDRFPIFDLVILGMGDDGHTASIFPHQIALWDSSNSCVIAAHPVSGQQRISISGGVINNARAVAFLATGKNKTKKVSEIIHKKPIAVNYPASLVAPKKGLLRWFLDSSAAQNL